MAKKSVKLLSSCGLSSSPRNSRYYNLRYKLGKSQLFCFICLVLLLALTDSVSATPLAENSPFPNRFPRSPLLPPTVTALQLSKRNGNVIKTKMERVGVQENLPAPPMTVHLSIPKRKKPTRPDVQRHHRKSSQLPVSPFVAARSVYRQPQQETTEIVLLKQTNDHRPLATKEPEAKHLISQPPPSSKDDKIRTERRNSSKAAGTVKPCNTSENLEAKFTNYQNALKSVKVSKSEAILILRKKGVHFEEFTNFVAGGATKEQILQILYVPHTNSLRNKSPKDSSRPKTDMVHADAEIGRVTNNVQRHFIKKAGHLSDLFTEIVHDVPVVSDRGYKRYDIPTFAEQKYISIRKYHVDNNKHVGNVWGTKRKYSKSTKYIKDISRSYSTKNKALLLQPDFNDLPSKDSPMIAHYREPAVREQEKAGSASILSLSIEKKMDEVTKSSKELSDNTSEKEKTGKMKDAANHTPLSMQGPIKEDKTNNKTNFRFVFPIRGILIFCGVIGIIAFLTTLILIIYTALKCNKKPVLNSYQMTEEKTVES